MAIRLLVADEQDLVRSGLASMLEGTNIEMVGEATSCVQVMQLAAELRPDVILLEIQLPGGNELQSLGQLKLNAPGIPVLLFSGHENPAALARAIALGANGFLHKRESRPKIIEAITHAASGVDQWPVDQMRRVRGALAVPRLPTGADVSLTQREGDVLRAITEGMTNKQISTNLSISYETVKEHVRNILNKVGVADRTQAAVWAVRQGLA